MSTLLETRRPEDQMMLRAARVSLDEEAARALRKLALQNPNWRWLGEQAAQHSLLPLVLRHCGTLCPPAIRDEWTARVTALQVGNMRLTAGLLAFLPILEKENIPCSVLKGPAAAVGIYGDLGLRVFGDIDLLVRPAHAGIACALLRREGFCSQFDFPLGYDAVFFREYSELLFRKADLAIDLHWRLLPPGYSFTPSEEALWGHRDAVPVGDRNIATLNPEQNLRFFCLHGAKHDWLSLGWLCDLAELIRKNPSIEWDRLFAQSTDSGCGCIIWTGLRLANELLQAPVPRNILNRPELTNKLVTALIERIVEDALPIKGEPPPHPLWPWRSIYYRTMDRPRDRWRLIHDELLAPTPLEWAAFRLPVQARWLHYGLRPLRLLAKRLVALRR